LVDDPGDQQRQQINPRKPQDFGNGRPTHGLEDKPPAEQIRSGESSAKTSQYCQGINHHKTCQ
jgi:hypothetical protein